MKNWEGQNKMSKGSPFELVCLVGSCEDPRKDREIRQGINRDLRKEGEDALGGHEPNHVGGVIATQFKRDDEACKYATGIQ